MDPLKESPAVSIIYLPADDAIQRMARVLAILLDATPEEEPELSSAAA